MPTKLNKRIPFHWTACTPPVKNTADHKSRFCMTIETSVTVAGVEYLRPRRAETSARAEGMAVMNARSLADISRRSRVRAFKPLKWENRRLGCRVKPDARAVKH